jgi:hypothetical protein
LLRNRLQKYFFSPFKKYFQQIHESNRNNSSDKIDFKNTVGQDLTVKAILYVLPLTVRVEQKKEIYYSKNGMSVIEHRSTRAT